MYICRLFGSQYPCNHEHARDFQTIFSSLISKNVYLPVSKFSNTIITSGLNNGDEKLMLSVRPLTLKNTIIYP